MVSGLLNIDLLFIGDTFFFLLLFVNASHDFCASIVSFFGLFLFLFSCFIDVMGTFSDSPSFNSGEDFLAKVL
ncbi:hypothetical protein AYI68_g6433 [Smittium mucronatum]|uniref:Uncharacterized protein n=1 Tax=Smittium mucronatum TaxID=133383 RepID=A0A1R0GRJ2_9FUNG|nr:hypothetical protein AYI68_g6433 [Smittium mucronatum]